MRVWTLVRILAVLIGLALTAFWFLLASIQDTIPDMMSLNALGEALLLGGCGGPGGVE
jgi:hypothetical protein